ncbi:MAG TPA: hypothetical protein PK530_03630 [Anaerolineales bacterium]|nr:hypothetical protein [Anaerolineales bacterium]
MRRIFLGRYADHAGLGDISGVDVEKANKLCQKDRPVYEGGFAVG